MAEHATDYGKLAGFDTELTTLLGEQDALELAWLEAAETLD